MMTCIWPTTIDLFTSHFSCFLSSFYNSQTRFFTHISYFAGESVRFVLFFCQPFSTFSFSRSKMTCLSWLSSSNLLSLSFLSASKRSLSSTILPEIDRQKLNCYFSSPFPHIAVSVKTQISLYYCNLGWSKHINCNKFLSLYRSLTNDFTFELIPGLGLIQSFWTYTYSFESQAPPALEQTPPLVAAALPQSVSPGSWESQSKSGSSTGRAAWPWAPLTALPHLLGLHLVRLWHNHVKMYRFLKGIFTIRTSYLSLF